MGKPSDYDGRGVDPPYECPQCVDLKAKLMAVETKCDRLGDLEVIEVEGKEWVRKDIVRGIQEKLTEAEAREKQIDAKYKELGKVYHGTCNEFRDFQQRLNEKLTTAESVIELGIPKEERLIELEQEVEHLKREVFDREGKIDAWALEVEQVRHELEDEKSRRLYYMNIVYDVCNTLDAILGRQAGSRTVVGTIGGPSNGVQDAMKQVHMRLQAAEADRDKHDGQWVTQECLEKQLADAEARFFERHSVASFRLAELEHSRERIESLEAEVKRLCEKLAEESWRRRDAEDVL